MQNRNWVLVLYIVVSMLIVLIAVLWDEKRKQRQTIVFSDHSLTLDQKQLFGTNTSVIKVETTTRGLFYQENLIFHNRSSRIVITGSSKNARTLRDFCDRHKIPTWFIAHNINGWKIVPRK